MNIDVMTQIGAMDRKKVEHILSRRLFDRLYWSWYGAGATGVGWELWLLGARRDCRWRA